MRSGADTCLLEPARDASAAADDTQPAVHHEADGPAGDVLLVSELFPPSVGGSAQLFGNIYSRLRGIRTSVLTRRVPAGQRELTAAFRSIREIGTSRRHWGVLHPGSLIGNARSAAYIRNMSKDGVSGVHCGRVLPEGLSAMLAGLAGGAPYACWVHGEELAYIDSSRELRRLASMVFRRAQVIFANSRNTAALLRHRGVPPQVVHVIRPGVDTELFHPRVAGSQELRKQLAGHATTLCLTVGRLQRRKGHDLVLRALSKFGERLETIRYVIVGEGEERPRLESMVRELGLDAAVTFVGGISSAELPRYYAAADLFVMPNRIEQNDFEGFGIVFLEAAACGLPVVAGRSGGVPEAVADGETGLLVSGDDCGELVDALAALIADDGRRRTMSLAGRERVLRDFTWQRAADQISSLHRQIFPL